MASGDGLVVLGLAWGLGAAMLILAWLWPWLRAGADRAAAARGAADRAGRSRPSPIEPTVAVLPAPFSGKAYVIDGDTIKVSQIRVRLFGMDAPELSQAGGHRARSQMIRLAGGREVTVLPVALDVYGRTVARVMLGTTDLSERMVLDGFAVATRRWCSDYVEAEEMARDTRQGLWRRDTINGIGDPAIHRRTRAGPADATPRPERAPRPSGKGRGVLLAFPFGGRRR